jgi:hypothetical protein
VIRAASIATVCALVFACTTTTKIVPGAGSSGATGDRRDSVPCTAGDVTTGIQAYDQTAEGGGAACDVGTVLDEDDAPATIGRPDQGAHTIAGKQVTGCIGVEFGDAVELSAIIMKMRPVSGGCGHNCVMQRDGCGSGGTVVIFTGQSLESLEFLQTMALTEKVFFEYSVSVRKDKKARFAVVCRDAAAPAADAIAIDRIAGRCY